MTGKNKPLPELPATPAEDFERMTVEELLEGLEEDNRRTLQIEEAADEVEERISAAFEDAGGGDAGLAAMEAMRRKITQ